MSEAEDHAAAPVFKKRSRPAAGAGRAGRLDASREEDQDGAAATAKAEGEQEAELSVQDLLTLRSLGKKPTGIALERLNAGDKKKGKQKGKGKSSEGKQTEEEKWHEQMRNGGLVAKSAAVPAAGEDSDEEEAPRKLVRANNFQGETGTIDVDAHMLAYIESEMAARRAASSSNPSSSSSALVGAGAAAPTAADVARASGNPEDELYRIAERYRKIQDEARAKEMKKENEGGVSAAMLSGVVEVDLGMESKLKNIEETELAKRRMEAANRTRKAVNEEDELLATARFFRPQSSIQSDADAARLSEANKDAEEAAVGLMGARSRGAFTFPEGHAFQGEVLPGASAQPHAQGQDRGMAKGNKREEKASDDKVVQRFKKRQRNQLKR